MFRRCLIALAAVTVAVSTPLAQTPAKVNLAELKTTAEATDYKSTSTYEDVVKFMKAVDAASPVITYTTYGTTTEGRPMPMAVVGTGLTAITPAAVKATGKLRVHIQGNIHAGEVEGKEAAQVLLREFAMGEHKDWLQTTVFLITPIFNADGNERFAMKNRGPQNGPINGQGTRAQAMDLNINGDFMKLETPEAKAFVKLWNEYAPHVGFDLHTSDGSTHGYHLTYSPGLNPNTSKAIIDIQKNDWFPAITKNIKAKHGWETFYYGNVSGGARGGRGGRGGAPGAPGTAGAAGAPPAAAGARGAAAAPPTAPPVPEVVGAQTPAPPAPPQAWATFEHVPRFHNNYVGMRNRFALLSEAYAYATFKDRILATNYFMEEALNYASANAAKLKKACADADKEAVIGTTLATRAQIKRAGMIEILMGEVEDELNPNNGARMNRRKDVIKPVQMIDALWFEPTITDSVATTYYVPATATKAIDLLKLHGLKMTKLTAPVKAATLEAFTITSNTQRPQANASIDLGTHRLRSLDGSWQPASTDIPAGSYAIDMAQPLARLAFYLLAPTSDDGLVNWNYLDDVLGDGVKTAPIMRKK
jgi:hypothetical protein